MKHYHNDEASGVNNTDEVKLMQDNARYGKLTLSIRALFLYGSLDDFDKQFCRKSKRKNKVSNFTVSPSTLQTRSPSPSPQMPSPRFPFPLTLGTDLCHIPRIQSILQSARGPRFIRKVLTAAELDDSNKRGLAILDTLESDRRPIEWKSASFIAGR